MDLPGSARTPRFPCISASFNAIRSREYIHLRKQFELTLRERVIESWRELDNLTPHDYHHSSRIMRTCHTHFGVPLGISPDWWDNRKRYHKPVLPIYLRLNISNIFSRALSCLCLSGHNFLVQRMRHNRNRPSELMICDKCGWHSVQDEEHILLDCPHEHHLVSLRTQHRQLVFPPWGAIYEHLRVVPPGKRLRVPSRTRPEILGSG